MSATLSQMSAKGVLYCGLLCTMAMLLLGPTICAGNTVGIVRMGQRECLVKVLCTTISDQIQSLRNGVFEDSLISYNAS